MTETLTDAAPFTRERLTALRGERCARVNEMIAVIKTTGRRFFAARGGSTIDARMLVDSLGFECFVDDYSGKAVRITDAVTIRGLNHGSGVTWFLRCCAEYVRDGVQMDADDIGVHWGYGADIERVRDAAVRCGFAYRA